MFFKVSEHWNDEGKSLSLMEWSVLSQGLWNAVIWLLEQTEWNSWMWTSRALSQLSSLIMFAYLSTFFVAISAKGHPNVVCSSILIHLHASILKQVHSECSSSHLQLHTMSRHSFGLLILQMSRNRFLSKCRRLETFYSGVEPPW